MKPQLVLALAVALLLILALPARAASKYKVLHDFGSGNDGVLPYGPLVLGKAGNLYGETYEGGTGACSDYGCGVIFELIPQANGMWRERLLHDFTGGSDGAFPRGRLIFDCSENLYGTTDGSPVNKSEAFELSPGSGGWSLNVLYDNGAGPGLVLDKAGNLYGDIGPGDYFGVGAIGELSSGSNGWAYTQLYSFCTQSGCADGRSPVDPPIWDTYGNLYGTTYYGGIGQPKCWNALGCGVVFQMIHKPDGTWRYHILHRFASFPHDGQSPAAGLVRDASGNLYGNTVFGGAHDNGTIFKFTASTGGRWKQTVLYEFPNCANGCLPGGTLVFDKAGSLYGAASGGLADCGGYTCGMVFKLTPQTGGKWKYSVLHKFNGADGGFPYGVILDDKGNLYGTTQAFGKYNAGVAFEINP